MRTFDRMQVPLQQQTSFDPVRWSESAFGTNHALQSVPNSQRGIGNQAGRRSSHPKTEGVEAGGGYAPAAIHRAHDFSRIPVYHQPSIKIQTALKLSTPGDTHEREADRVSDRVMRMPELPPQHDYTYDTHDSISRKEQTEGTRGQSQSGDYGRSVAPPVVQEALHSAGQPLHPETRAFMEPRFGHDFSQVRVHTDAKAAASARAVNALAYTVGRDIVFDRGQYAPDSPAGQRLVAHELTHVVQQTSGLARSVLQRADPPQSSVLDAEETEAATPDDEEYEETETDEIEPQLSPAARQIDEDYRDLMSQLAAAQMTRYTRTRRDLMNELEAAVPIGELADKSPDELLELRDNLDFMKLQVSYQYEIAHEEWLELQEEHRSEAGRLQDAPDHASTLALATLEEEHSQTEQVVNGVGMALVEEDFASLRRMLMKRTHVEHALKQTSREEAELGKVEEQEKQAESEDKAAEADEQDPSMLGMAWDVLGWESVEDFAADVAVTALTAGVGKAFKFLSRSQKAKYRLERLKKARELRKIRRGEKIAERAHTLDRLIETLKAASESLGDQMAWVKKNRVGVGRKIATDIAAAAASEEGLDDASTIALNRVNKQYINSWIEDYYGVSAKTEEQNLRRAFTALVVGKEGTGKALLVTYLKVNGRRRLLTNLIHNLITTTGQLDMPLDAKVLVQVLNTTAFEMAQDMVGALPGLDKLGARDALETIRKILQQAVQNKINELL